MNQKEFARELSLWERTGYQDAGNTLDPKEIEEDFGPTPTKKQLVEWLIGASKPEDFEGGLEFPKDTTVAQRQQLLERWADGWASYAVVYMKHMKRKADGEET